MMPTFLPDPVLFDASTNRYPDKSKQLLKGSVQFGGHTMAGASGLTERLSTWWHLVTRLAIVPLCVRDLKSFRRASDEFVVGMKPNERCEPRQS